MRDKSKRGNIAAVALIIVLLMLGITVMVYRPFIPAEERVDYGEVFSEVRSGVERGYFESFTTSMTTGFSIKQGGVFYWNNPYDVPLDLVEKRLKELIEDTIRTLEFAEGTETIILGDIQGSYDVVIEDEGVVITLEDAYVEIVSGGERRRVDLTERYVIPTELKKMHENLNEWLACDAGGLTELFKEFQESKPCQFSNCCCGKEPLTQEELDRVKGEYGIKRDDVIQVLFESVEVLNHLMSGAESCEEEVELREDMTCFVSESESIIEVRTDADVRRRSDKLCAGTDEGCELQPYEESSGQLYDWSNPQRVNFDGVDELETDTLIENELPPDTSIQYVKHPLPDEDGDDSHDYLYEVGLDRKAAGDVTIVCRNPDRTATDYQEMKFRIKFKHNYHCYPPDDEPDWDNEDLEPIQCAGGSDSAPALCTDPDTEEGSLCAPEDGLDHHVKCPVRYICGAVSAESGELRCVPDYQALEENDWVIDEDLIYPDHNDLCLHRSRCTVCGAEAMCDTPATENIRCARVGGCISIMCSGEGIGIEHCGLPYGREVPVDSRCERGHSSCPGFCDMDIRTCNYGDTDGDDCVYVDGECRVDGECSGGSCEAELPGVTCCGYGDDSFYCGSDQPYCCGSYCSADSSCPAPT